MLTIITPGVAVAGTDPGDKQWEVERLKATNASVGPTGGGIGSGGSI